jgi:choline dehydrogenase-like flavoprotein
VAGDALHGDQGPLYVSDLRYTNPLSQAFIDAGQQAGYPRNRDFNGPHQQGFGLYQVTQKDGARCSAAVAYLHPIRERHNLTVVTGAQASRITFDPASTGAQRRERCHLLGRRQGFHQVATREVLLSGGAINSPQLLMLSGIGPAHTCAGTASMSYSTRPQVGENLQDHLDICTLQHSTQRVTYDRVSDAKIAFRLLPAWPQRPWQQQYRRSAAPSCVRGSHRTIAPTSSSISFRRCSTTTAATALLAMAIPRMPVPAAAQPRPHPARPAPMPATRRGSRPIT